MPFIQQKEKLEQRIEKMDLKLQELGIDLEYLDENFNQVLSNLNITSEELYTYIEDPKNFSPETQKKFEKERMQLDEKLNLALKNVKDPLKTKKTFSEKKEVQSHWLFVR
jgi:hypothetical protein